MLARIVRTLAASSDVAELEISVYDRLHDEQAKRLKETLVSRCLRVVLQADAKNRRHCSSVLLPVTSVA